jgi:hypothetical protein
MPPVVAVWRRSAGAPQRRVRLRARANTAPSQHIPFNPAFAPAMVRSVALLVEQQHGLRLLLRGLGLGAPSNGLEAAKHDDTRRTLIWYAYTMVMPRCHAAASAPALWFDQCAGFCPV